MPRQSTVWPIWFWPLFGLGLLANLLPLVVAPILPFNDLHGAAGLLGAWVRQDDTAARIHDYFTFSIRPAPNVSYWAVGWVLTHFVSVRVATTIYIAVFCVVGLPVAFLVALRSLNKDPTLSFLAFPLIYHRCLWYGFMGNVLAVPLLILVIAFANLAFAHPGWSWRDAALAATMVALSTAHAFLYLVTLGMLLLWAFLAGRNPSSLIRRLVVSVPSLLYLGPWLGARLFGGRSGPGGFRALVGQMFRARQPLLTCIRSARDWLIDGYVSPVDDWVAAVFLATLLAFLLVGVRPLESTTALSMRPRDRLWAARLPLTAGLLSLGYFLLPMSISLPLNWWAVNVRLLVPALLVIALLIPARQGALPRTALLPVMAAAILYGFFLTYDFRTWWVNTELSGFTEAIAAIPPGKRLLALYPPFDNERHYSHFPMGYIVNYYIVDRGGTVAPVMWGVDDLWIRWRPQGPAPGWGRASSFQWKAHAAYWDYFLAKQPAPGNGPRLALFSDAPRGAVTRIFERGLWSVWRREDRESMSPDIAGQRR